MEYGVQTHNKFAFLDGEDLSDGITFEPSRRATAPKQDQPRTGGRGGPREVNLRNDQRQVKPTDAENKESEAKPKEAKPKETKPKEAKNGGLDSNVGLDTEYGSRRATAPKRGQPRTGGRGGPRGVNFRNDQRQVKPTEAENKSEVKPKENENTGWDSNVGWDNEDIAVEPPKTEEKVENAVVVEEAKETNTETEVDQTLREKTYEEWKSEQKNAEQIHFNIRKPGEGDDQKLYQKLIPMKNQNAKGPKLEEEIDESAQHKEKREKALLIDVSFVDKRSGFGGGNSGFAGQRGGGPRGERSRGGGNRGGARGGGGGGPRGNYGGGGGISAGGAPKRQQGGSFTLENEQFPALGAAH
uniref:Hyaluronan/mRNA-binding protein domain-containing protein n=1 Tax=Globodera rostochiensis TaxID=31243 RepID=A0A914HX36_GLORO